LFRVDFGLAQKNGKRVVSPLLPLSASRQFGAHGQ
jgi:hypothetical protein